MIPGSANALLLGSAAGDYTISRSLRFNSADSAYLSRTPASAGNRKTWTWAGWVKRSRAGATQRIFAASTASTFSTIGFLNTDTLFYLDYNSGFTTNVQSTAFYRDLSAWYHIVVRYNTAEATASDRVKLYVNGSQVTQLSSTSYPTLNYDGFLNSTIAHAVGGDLLWSEYANAYLADIHFIDGQALDPTSFGEFSTTTGVWMPKRYTGTYGTNGFKLDFADNSAATATTLGKDSSGNGNNWTPNNLSVTAGAGNDSLVDVPVNGTQPDTGAGGEVRGNYCTWNPLDLLSTTLANGNLQAAGSTDVAGVSGTIGVSSGKWYWEVTSGSAQDDIGVWPTSSRVTGYPGYTSDSYGYYGANGQKINSALGYAYGSTFASGDVIGVALDLDAGTLVFYKNNVSQGTAFSGLTGGYRPAVRAGSALGSSTATYLNAGQRPWAYQAPAGFKALCTANLPAPTIVKPSTVMDVLTWTGDGTDGRSITGLGFSPDFSWMKSRSTTFDHRLENSIITTHRLNSNTASAEISNFDAFSLLSNGIRVSASVNDNNTSQTYVAWTWDAGGSTVTNTQGTISSQVRANASAGFSIVTGTAPAGNFTCGHGLGGIPSLIIVKERTATSAGWPVHHRSVCANTAQHLGLQNTNGVTSATEIFGAALPTGSVFGAKGGLTFATGATFVAYCFAPVAGYSAFGSYTGNGSADGPMVFTNMRPRWIMIKRTDSTGNWTIIDAAREGYNVDNDPLYPNTADAEGTADLADIVSNGFKLRSTDASVNASAGTYVYACFAESPFSLARAR